LEGYKIKALMKTWFYLLLSSLSFAVSAPEYIQRRNPVSTYGPIQSLSWSPDGSQFVVCCRGHQTAYAMTSRGGDRKNITSKKEQGNATCVAWCPSPYIAVGTDQGSIAVWNTVTKQISSLMYPETAPQKLVGKAKTLSLAWNPRKKSQLAVGYNTSALLVWNALAQKQKLCSILEHQAGKIRHSKVNTVAWSPDGRLASGADDNTIRIWNLNQQICSKVLSMSGVQSICWGPGKMLVAGGVVSGRLRSIPAVKVWDVDAQVSTEKELDESVNAVDWSRDGSLIAVGANRGKVYLLEPESRNWRQAFECTKSTPPSVGKANNKPATYTLTANATISSTQQEESGANVQQIGLSLAFNVVKTFIASMLRRSPPAVRDVKWNSQGELAAGNEESEGRVFVYVPKKTFSTSCWDCLALLCCCCRKSRIKAE
jgi:WD40 repeat protein